MMTPEIDDEKSQDPFRINRRTALRSTLAMAGTGVVAAAGQSARGSQPAQTDAADTRKASSRTFRMKKSINLWAFPYPDRMSLDQCLQLAKEAGFDGIELNYDLDNDLSPRSASDKFQAIRKRADQIGIAISGLCSFLYWPYSLTDNDPRAASGGWNWPS